MNLKNTLQDLVLLTALVAAYVVWSAAPPSPAPPSPAPPSPAPAEPGAMRLVVVHDKENASGAIKGFLNQPDVKQRLTKSCGQYWRYWDSDDSAIPAGILATLHAAAIKQLPADLNDAAVAVSSGGAVTVYVLDDADLTGSLNRILGTK